MKNVQIPTVEYRQGIYYLILDGKSPYERGYQHGAALEFPIKKALRQFKAWIRQNVGLDDPEEMSPLTRASPIFPVPITLIFLSFNMNSITSLTSFIYLS